MRPCLGLLCLAVSVATPGINLQVAGKRICREEGLFGLVISASALGFLLPPVPV